MKPRPLLLVPLFALALSSYAQSTSGAATGDTDASAAAPNSQKTHRAEVKERFLEADSNGDGKLSRAEAQSLPNLAKHFDAIDLNHDGYLTREEVRTAREHAKAQRAGGSSGNAASQSADQAGNGTK